MQPKFANHVLLSALQAPGAATSAPAARTIAGLIGLLAAEGADEEVAAILAPVPGRPATFDVVAVGAGSPAVPSQASQERLDLPEGSPAPESPTGPESPGPGAGSSAQLTGLEVGRALREASRLAQGRADLISVVAVCDQLRRRVLERKEGAPFRFLFPSEDTFEGDDEARTDAISSWETVLCPPSIPGPTPAPTATPPDAPAVSPVGMLSPVAPEPSEPDGAETPGAYASEAESVWPEPAAREAASPAPSTALAATRSVEMLAETVRDALSDVTVEVDMGAIEQVVSDALRAAIATARVREGVVATEPPGGWVTHAALIGAAEQLHVLMEAFNDRIRSGSRSLEALADELSARERNAAAFTEALGKSINASMDRVLRHIDDRLDQLPATRPGPGADR